MLYVLCIIASIPFIWYMYLVVTSVYGFIKKEILIPSVPPKNKFLCVVAARNEEAVIKELINSINSQDYPKELFDIVVIINNCTDHTRDICIEQGVNVMEPNVAIRSKGDALMWAFEEMRGSNVDAYAIFDADNVVHKSFLKEMNNALEKKYDICQGTRVAKNLYDNFLTKCYDIYYLLNNLMFYTRSKMGSSSPVNGTGYVIRKKYIDEYGYNTKTYTEDMELAGQAAIRNNRVAYIKNAITYDEQPVKFPQSFKQLKRWSIGCRECTKIYLKDLLKSFKIHKNIFSLDMAFLYSVQFFQIIMVFEYVIVFIFKLLNVEYAGNLFIFLMVMFLVLTVACCLVACWGILTADSRSIRKSFTGILFFPFFMIVIWPFASVASIFSKKNVWAEVVHTRAVSIDDL